MLSIYIYTYSAHAHPPNAHPPNARACALTHTRLTHVPAPSRAPALTHTRPHAHPRRCPFEKNAGKFGSYKRFCIFDQTKLKARP